MKQFKTCHLIIPLSKYWAHNGYKGSRIWVHQIHMGFMTDSDEEAKETIYTDQTGAFPTRSKVEVDT